MKPERMLTLSSLLAVVLATLHLADDIVRGYEPTGLSNMSGVVLFTVWLCAALLLPERRLRYVLLVLGSLLAIVMPVTHMLGKGLARAAVSEGGLFFIWVLIALGVTGIFSLILAVDGLWRLRRGHPAA
jgi:hypothetical protein